MSLPMSWIDKIFLKLTVHFGRDFLGRWEGIPIADVKAEWAECLAGFADNPGAIGYALANLHDNKPPTAQDFRTVCLRAPAPDLPRLPAPAVNPDRMAQERSRCAVLTSQHRAGGAGSVASKDWARKIITRHQAGERVNVGPLRDARIALGLLASNATA